MRVTTKSFRLAAAAGLLAACGRSQMDPSRPTPPLAAGQVLTTSATISFLNLEGGCWTILTDGGARYEPLNLATQFKTDGARVRVVLRDAPDFGSLCQVGPLVTVDSITVR